MSAAKQDLTIEQGVTWQHAWQVRLDGVSLDPAADWRGRSQVRKKKDSDDVLHEFTVRVVGDIVQLSVLPDESSAWNWRRGVFDIELYDSSMPPRVVRLVEGVISVSPEVTRDPA